MNFNLLLFEGTDVIKFGMTGEEVCAKLHKKPVGFKKSEHDLYETENYNEICHVYYESADNGVRICSAIEFFKPSQVFLDGIQLLCEPRRKVENLFNAKFGDCINDVSGCRSKKYDIAFFSPNDVIESVYIARKGYCDEQERFYNQAFKAKYPVREEIVDITMRKHLCPSCMSVIIAKDGALCPRCNVILL